MEQKQKRSIGTIQRVELFWLTLKLYAKKCRYTYHQVLTT